MTKAVTTGASIEKALNLDITLSRFSAWLQDPSACGHDYSPRTVKSYVSALKSLHTSLSVQLGGDADMEKLVPRDLVLARQAILSSGGAASSANMVIAAGKAWARALGREGEFISVKLVRTGWAPRRSLSRVEYNRLLRALDGEAVSDGSRNAHDTGLRDKAAFALLLGSGLRAEEATRVVVKDITLGPKSGQVRVRYGKGLKGRSVPVPQTFRAWLKDRVAEVYAGGNERDFESALVLGKLTTDNLRRIVSKWGSRAGFTGLHPHMLRRTRAQMWRKEKGLEEAQLRLGHEKVDTTVRYTAVLEEDGAGQELPEDLEA